MTKRANNNAVNPVRWPFTYLMNGREVRPPKDWQRGRKWDKPSDCVKTCKMCKEPLWRLLHDCPSEWESRKVHPGECQHQYVSLLASKLRAAQLAKPNKRDIAKDAEQVRVDKLADQMYIDRMWLNHNHPVTQHYLRGALI